jgi:Peptidase family M1 domain
VFMSELVQKAKAFTEGHSYRDESLSVSGTQFHLFAREHCGLPMERIKNTLRLAWPKFVDLLGNPIEKAVIMDFDAPVGGGPLDRYIIGLFYSETVEPEFQKVIENAAGWAPQPSTAKYIDKHYIEFENPIDAYVDDMLIHELGHLYFGFGDTLAPKDLDNAWFSFGLGILYDRLIWDQLNSKPSPLFSSIDKQWKMFSKNESIDQRLVNPTISNDASVGLNRRQVYGHGKAAAYLSALRVTLGVETFDSVVRRYLEMKKDSVIEYDDFLCLLPSQVKTPIWELERKWLVR